ncbi:hypothetical protein SLA2020_215760 [Shorea laevis]
MGSILGFLGFNSFLSIHGSFAVVIGSIGISFCYALMRWVGVGRLLEANSDLLGMMDAVKVLWGAGGMVDSGVVICMLLLLSTEVYPMF